MIYSIRGLFAFTTLCASCFVITIAVGATWAFGWAIAWLPIATAILIHQSAPSRFRRNILLLVPSTIICWIAICSCHLAMSWQFNSLGVHEVFIESFELFPLACIWGCMHGLCITIGYCMLLNLRYRLSEEIRPLNGNDILTRQWRTMS